MRYTAVLIAALMWAPLSFAGYAQLAPPSTWAGAPGAWTSTSAANASSFYQNGWRAAGGVINVAGRPVTMPARYTMAANAGRFAAQAIRLNPALLVGSLVVSWLATECIEHQGGEWVITCGPGVGQPSDGYEYNVSSPGPKTGVLGYFPTAEEACIAWGQAYVVQHSVGVYTGSEVNADQTSCTVHYMTPNNQSSSYSRQVRKRSSSCPEGWYYTEAGCVETPQPRPADDDDWDQLANQPMPVGLPGQVPGPWPVDVPLVDPMRVPTGDPVPVPGSDPQTFTQPSVDIKPAPVPESPWRVSIEPVDVPVPDPESAPTGPVPLEPESEVGTGRPPEGVCEQYPDALACQKLGMIEPVELRDDERDLSSIEPDDGWGQGAGACPAPTTITIRGQEISDDWSLMCNFATEIRPIVIGVAWVIAGLTFFGFSRRD